MLGLRAKRPVLAVIALLGATACTRDPQHTTLTVYAAASLAEVFHELERDFEAAHPGVDVQLQLAGSQLLASQLLEGADAQVFASANPAQLDRVAEGRQLRGRRAFAGNSIVVVVPKGSDIGSVVDLANPGCRVVMAGEAVPAGRYAREALDTLGLRSAVEANLISNETDVRGVIGKLALGEADAGLAYATDVATAEGLIALPLPDDAAVTAHYELAVIIDGKAEASVLALADEFADFVSGPAGAASLAAHGFSPNPDGSTR
ncbi:MAG: molybdate ABC transporter substrate-binding protein [Myxococcales bacterium]|nr:molybdate ABC transporter substrate-binding protein [Myxococcales bacterium]